MNYKIPGLTSIILFFIAIGIAAVDLFTVSISLGIVNIVLLPLIFLNVFYWYCRKCPHIMNGTCRHVILGKITHGLFNAVAPAKYSFKEIIFTLLPLIILIIFPQYWLFQNKYLFIAFWIFMLVAVIIVRTGVCTGCKNTNCAFCPNSFKVK
jgi:hypothetical protein